MQLALDFKKATAIVKERDTTIIEFFSLLASLFMAYRLCIWPMQCNLDLAGPLGREIKQVMDLLLFLLFLDLVDGGGEH